MTYLVDTDYVADYLKGYHAATSLLQTLFPKGIGISIVTYGEVYEGIYYGHNKEKHEQGFRLFLRATPILGISQAVARQFATIRGDLRAKGLLIPDPDLYIAATAIHHGLTLVTRNVKDYTRIPIWKFMRLANTAETNYSATKKHKWMREAFYPPLLLCSAL